ncbi:MAG: molybdate ABC transporter substrate-binding protein [Acidobacteria bacterium]|nr:molybdate ABC transporter substrate-binding protein [Acidobacteriota bacterium]
MPRRPTLASLAVLAVPILGVAAAVALRGSGSTTADPGVTGTVTVFAASSLTDVFTDMGKRFEDAHPGANVVFSFAASSTLAAQVNQGAPADVLATADEDSMQTASKAGSTANPTRFARNILQVVVPTGNPKSLTGIHDLDRVSYALCDQAVPCGKYSALALKKNGMTPHPRSYETNVRNVLARVISGEVDAGIVYRTDVIATKGSATGVDIADADDPDLQNIYPIAVVNDTKNKNTAQAWADYVTSAAGQRVLASYAFLPAPR